MRAAIPPLVLALGLALPATGVAQALPPHSPLRILIVSDEVNPHSLPPQDLTQPGDISAALLATPALHLDAGAEAVLEIPTNQIEQATNRLARPFGDADAYDVLLYFAHRIPDNGSNDPARQEAFAAAVASFLAAGGGVVSFHHGIYSSPGKDSILAILGAEASGAVPWDTTNGQNVISVATRAFVSSYGVTYPSTTTYADPAHGIPSAAYPFFNNTPDERYPTLVLRPDAGDVRILFASDYADNGSTHLLGFLHHRPTWSGIVAAYQPGEYQPHALGPGNPNFQILLNALVFTAAYHDGEILFGDGFETGDLSLWSAVVP